MRSRISLTLILIALSLAACAAPGGESRAPTPIPTLNPATLPAPASEPAEPESAPAEPGAAAQPGAAEAAAAFATGGCGACHVIPGIPNAAGSIGPDLSQMQLLAQATLQEASYTGSAQTVREYILEAILEPDAYLAAGCGGGPCPPGLMPASLGELLRDNELQAIVDYLAGLTGEAPEQAPAPEAGETELVALGPAPVLTEQELAETTQIFFDRCAGCHGVLRNGATGPALTPDRTLPMGTTALSAIIFNGTPRGMPDWGQQGVLTQAQAELMAKFIQNEPPTPPEMSLEQMNDSWQVRVPVDQRPTEPEHDRDWENYFAVTLRDAGQVAMIDGDTFEVVNKVESGYAVHISRMSATGRYIYTIGRDGKAVLIDTWMELPDIVAEVKVCYDARSIEVSKYNGPEGDFTDQYAVIGCYWPPHFVILDGLTLEPFKVISTRSYTYDTEEYHPEPRVAAIVASHFKPEWIVNVKETGQVWLVNYADPQNPTIKMIEAERFLHDGGWDATQRYFMVAANQANRIAVIDALDGELEALVDTPAVPHPGRGANWIDPDFGPVWTTSHLGEGSLIAIGTDPEDHPQYAWQVVREISLLGGGSLFVKTHPNSPWIWVDHTLNPDESIQRSVCVIAKENPTETYRCWEIADYGRAVHFEYNRAGTQVWVSVWGTADQPGRVGEIVIYDDATLEEVARIPDLVTPTGKFNVYNTIYDVY